MEIADEREAERPLRVLTSNVSAGGVYFKTLRGNNFIPGAETDFIILLSTTATEGRVHPASLHGKGKVVRCEPPKKNASFNNDDNESWTGIAIQFDKPLTIC